MMSDLLAILGIAIVAYLFWQQRRQAELARQLIQRKCDELNLQLVSVSFAAHKLKTPLGQKLWHTQYNFEFSALGDDCYQGQLIMRGLQLQHFNIPPYRI